MENGHQATQGWLDWLFSILTNYESLRVVQGWAYWFITLFLVIGLYGYIYHLYKSQRTGKIDYEKYARLALDDNLDDALIEKRENTQKKES